LYFAERRRVLRFPLLVLLVDALDAATCILSLYSPGVPRFSVADGLSSGELFPLPTHPSSDAVAVAEFGPTGRAGHIQGKQGSQASSDKTGKQGQGPMVTLNSYLQRLVEVACVHCQASSPSPTLGKMLLVVLPRFQPMGKGEDRQAVERLLELLCGWAATGGANLLLFKVVEACVTALHAISQSNFMALATSAASPHNFDGVSPHSPHHERIHHKHARIFLVFHELGGQFFPLTTFCGALAYQK